MNKRLINLQSILTQHHLDAFLVTNQANIYYLTGVPFMKDAKELMLVVSKTTSFLFVRTTYSKEAKKYFKSDSIIEIGMGNTFTNRMNEVIQRLSPKNIGFESTDLTVAALNNIKKSSINVTWKPTQEIIETIRQIKDDMEIEHIRKAAWVTDAVFEAVLPLIKPGVREKDIALEIEYHIKKRANDIAFTPIVASGTNSASPHYIAGEQKVVNNSMVLLDFGAKVNGYCSDITRMVYLGKIDEQYKKVYNTVLTAQEKAIEYLIDHQRDETISAQDVDSIARNYIIQAHFPTIPHSLGHALGLDIHESPRLSPSDNSPLKPGMAFTIEPGIYLEGWGGVRIEDVVVWKDEGIVVLSKSSKQLLEVT